MSRQGSGAGDGTANSRGDSVGSITCLTNVDILLSAVDDVRIDARQIRHFRDCDRCRERLTDVRRVLAEVVVLPRGTAVSDAHLDEDALARIVDGRGNAPRDAARLAHLADCQQCRHELASLAALLSDPTVAAEIRAVEPRMPFGKRRSRWTIGGGIGALAAAAALVLFMRPHVGRVATTHRAPTITAATAPALASPVGAVPNARTFIWGAVPGTDQYRMTLFDAAGRVLYEADVTDTTLALPDSVAASPGRSYLWKVQARAGPDRWTTSDLLEFSVGARKAP